ncbi:hypothetical protein RB195_025334 [Necator americanus]|uniref:Uncharacterized protein n=1 Tax=Necator americanus TaxID=51031 RepID=A0ABR1ERV7_NECAM
MNRNDIFAVPAGDVLMISKCKSVQADEIYLDHNINGNCYLFTPVRIGKSIYFAQPGTRDLTSSSPKAHCGHLPFGIYNDGSAITIVSESTAKLVKEIIHKAELSEGITANGTPIKFVGQISPTLVIGNENIAKFAPNFSIDYNNKLISFGNTSIEIIFPNHPQLTELDIPVRGVHRRAHGDDWPKKKKNKQETKILFRREGLSIMFILSNNTIIYNISVEHLNINVY